VENRFVIGRAALPRIVSGHPWLYREALKPVHSAASAPETGDAVGLEDGEGKLVGRGIFDGGSPLAVRMWTRGDVRIDEALVEARLAHAFALRARLFEHEDTNAYRLVHGEGDRMPGLVIDRYAQVAVLRTDGDAAAAVFARHAGVFERQLRALGIETLLHRQVGSDRARPAQAAQRAAAGGPELAWGPAVTDAVLVREHGMPFASDLIRGQKTGSFLDQRDNRRRVRQLAEGRRVLNLFSYAGGFSQAAVLGGAAHVTSVDIAHDAHRTAHASFKLAGLDPSQHAFVTADAFQWLDSANQKFDLIVSDPPSFAPNEKSLPKALAAYKRLHRACARLLADDGLFCAASCSSHVDAKTFLGTLDDATLEERPLRVIEQHGAPSDHPVLPAFPEGAYLKFIVLR
jgi:23S rRNA (cytosine1962-C5)-methyltransferase